MFLAAMCPPILLWAFLAIFPQVMFKSKERTFEIGPNGIDTEIGGTTCIAIGERSLLLPTRTA